MSVLGVPFILQGVLMFVDEFYFHEKRRLPRWERWGHPLDSLTVLVPYFWILLVPFSARSLNVYVGLSLFSCLFVTKDEFVHQKECGPWEHWLHACLFLLHPLSFLAAGFLWQQDPTSLWLRGQPVIIAVFMLYQIIRWNVYASSR